MTEYAKLFLKYKQGDPTASRHLYDLTKAKLMGLCRRYARSREEAQDVLQESFIKIFANIQQLDSADRLEGWMKTITIRTAIDHYHKNKTHDLLFQSLAADEQNVGITPVSLAEATDTFLLELINHLPDGCRVIFNLAVVEGYDHAEIAKMLEISEGTSRSQLHRAKQLLQSKLKSHSLAEYYGKLA